MNTRNIFLEVKATGV